LTGHKKHGVIKTAQAIFSKEKKGKMFFIKHILISEKTKCNSKLFLKLADLKLISPEKIKTLVKFATVVLIVTKTGVY